MVVEMTLVRTKPCVVCGQDTYMEVPMSGYAAWKSGQYVQEAFPTLSDDEREMLITGTHPDCWDYLGFDEYE